MTHLDAGGFPIAESSGISTRYPKQWHLPEWKKVLSREDVDFEEVDMCAYGLGPPDQPNCFYLRRKGGSPSQSLGASRNCG